MSTILSGFLALFMSSTSVFIMASRRDLPNDRRFFSGRDPRPRSAYRLSKPLIGDDGRIYACSDRNLFAFENNGTIAWTAHLKYKCNVNIAPVRGDLGKIYLVAENKVLKIESMNGITSDADGEVFFGSEPGHDKEEEPGEIIGISVSRLSSTVYITVKNQALFAYSLQQQLLWSIGPVMNLHGYQLGCSKNPGNCFFSSAPVVDSCESQIYISNTEGELYSLSTRNPRFTWIRDLSSIGKVFTITAGNNGRLYVTVPVRALIMSLDVSNGNILWQKNVGPLSTLDSIPVVDSNGFLSIGSLDGCLYSISPSGVVKKFAPKGRRESVIQVSPILDCSGYGVYMSRTVMESDINKETRSVSASIPTSAALTLLVPQTGSIYWSQTYSGQYSSSLTDRDLRHFVLDECILLAFVAAAKTGNPLHCRNDWQRLASSCSDAREKCLSIYTGSERPTLLFLVFETSILIVLAVLVRFCVVFWRKRKLKGQGIGCFLEKRRCLLRQKKVLDRSLTELKQKADTEFEAISNDAVEELEKIVQGRDNINKKLSTTYSLGRDRVASARSKYSPPLHGGDDKMRSYSFQDARRGNVTIFHAMGHSSSSSTGRTTSRYSNRETSSSDSSMLHAKGKKVVVDEEISSSLVSSSSSSGDGRRSCR